MNSVRCLAVCGVQIQMTTNRAVADSTVQMLKATSGDPMLVGYNRSEAKGV